MINANRVQAMNDKIDFMMLMSPQALNPSDATVFPIRPSREVRPASDDDFETRLEDGRLSIARKSDGPLRTPEADLVRIDTGQSFCNACLSALGSLAKYIEQRLSVPDFYEMTDRLPPNVILHWNLLGLADSRSSGCHLCSLIFAHVNPRYLGRLEIMKDCRVELVLRFEKKDPKSSNEDPTAIEDIRLACALTPSSVPERMSDNYWTILKLRLWPSPENDGRFLSAASTSLDPSPAVLEVLPRGSNTRCAKDMAVDWLNRCKSNESEIHGACETQQQPWLPTRLIDLKNAQPGGFVRVTCPEKCPGLFTAYSPYVTLSHCWGDWRESGLPRLLEENKAQYEREGISFDQLPPLIRDAMEIAKWFEGKYSHSLLITTNYRTVRWLWIDSLCIIQDSPGMSDWNHEAVLMSKVYRYGLLNISADASDDARDGCFRDRLAAEVTPFKLHMANLQMSWWAAKDERDTFEWVTSAPLSRRAWVFQERQLARRVLHFTEREVFWECSATDPYCACETYPTGSPFPTRFLKANKYEPLAISTEDNETKLRVWYDLCEDFSAKDLSFEKDRLPALAGIATEFANLFPADVYVVGFWSSTLPESLLWSTKKSTRQMGILDAYSAPSWSWLSSKSDIYFGVLPKSDFKFRRAVAEVTALGVTPTTESPFGLIQQDAYIELQGFMRRLRIVKTPLPKSVNELDEWFMPHQTHDQRLYVDGSDRAFVDSGWLPPHHSTFSYSIDNSTQMQDEVGQSDQTDDSNQPFEWNGPCFLLAVSRHTETSKLTVEGLLLEETDKEGIFKRAGKISFSGLFVLSVVFQLSDDLSDQEVAKIVSSMPVLSQNEQSGHSRGQSADPVEAAIEGQTKRNVKQHNDCGESEQLRNSDRVGPEALYQIFSENNSLLTRLSCCTVRLI